jgi:hypothetical protein
MNSELKYIEEEIDKYTEKINKIKDKIKYIEKEYAYEPVHTKHILKQCYAKRYALNYRKKRILSYQNT